MPARSAATGPAPPDSPGALAMALARAAAKAKPSVPADPLAVEPAPAQPTATAPRSGEAVATPAARAVRRAAAAAAAARQAARQMAQKAHPSTPAPAADAPPHNAPAKTRRTAPAPRRASLRIHDLHDLASVARLLREENERAQAQAKAHREAAARLEAERHLFSRSVGPVTSLRNPNLARLRHRLPPPLPVQHWLDEERVLLESISDDFDVSTLLDTDDQLSFRRPGIGVEVTRRLRSGHWSIQRQLDLHGLRVDEAREALGQFIRHAHKTGLRCVRVVHGKGLGSPGKSPVLKSRVQRWLVQKNEVLAFVQARPMDGGAGALVVLLKPVNQRNT